MMRRRELLLLGINECSSRAERATSAMSAIGFPGGISFRALRAVCGRVPPRTERNRVCRGTNGGDRILLGPTVVLISCPH